MLQGGGLVSVLKAYVKNGDADALASQAPLLQPGEAQALNLVVDQLKKLGIYFLWLEIYRSYPTHWCETPVRQLNNLRNERLCFDQAKSRIIEQHCQAIKPAAFQQYGIGQTNNSLSRLSI